MPIYSQRSGKDSIQIVACEKHNQIQHFVNASHVDFGNELLFQKPPYSDAQFLTVLSTNNTIQNQWVAYGIDVGNGLFSGSLLILLPKARQRARKRDWRAL